MEQRIRLLDCTLRDGGHINKSLFGETVLKSVLKCLVNAKVDVIEAGFLMDTKFETDTARFYNIDDLKRVLPDDKGVSKYSLMSDPGEVDSLAHLEPYDGTVEYIRLSFKRDKLEWALETARMLMDKGYKCFINPVNCNVYTDYQYLQLLDMVNELNPYGFSIVDTFGVMRKRDLSHRYFLVENNLRQNVSIGLHLHENLGLAYCLAQHFVEIANPNRDILVDGSLLGMGRDPGNLCIEQFMDHCNVNYGTQYVVEYAYDAIDDHIAPIKAKESWGYSIPYALSAKYNLHRTYAEYLMSKKRIKTKNIQKILQRVNQSKAELFDEAHIETLYKEYMLANVVDSLPDINRLKEELMQKSSVLIVSPGESIKYVWDMLKKHSDENDTFVISVNFNPSQIGCDYVFCTNVKRYDAIEMDKSKAKIIVTSNLLNEATKHDYTISYNDLVYYDETYYDDSTVMLLHLLKKIGIMNIAIAGFDGFEAEGKLGFFDEQFAWTINRTNNNEKINTVLARHFCDMDIKFLTKSAHENYKQK